MSPPPAFPMEAYFHLEDNEDLVFGAADLEDFYHCFIVSDEHASRNHVHGVFPASVFKGWRCYRESLGDRPVVGCFRTLAMGTSFAVELAQRTHANLLRRAGCWTPSEQVRYHFPFPAAQRSNCFASTIIVSFRRFPVAFPYLAILPFGKIWLFWTKPVRPMKRPTCERPRRRPSVIARTVCCLAPSWTES